MELNELVRICHENAKEHGFWDGKDPLDPDVFKEKLLLLHSEISEAFEELRNGKYRISAIYDCFADLESSVKKPEGIPIELADLAIRLFDLVGAIDVEVGLNFEECILHKHAYNKTRPYKHGKTC